MTSLYLTYDGLTDPLGQSQILPYILGLEEKGISFHIISFEKKKVFEKNESIVRNLIRNRKITWLPLPYHKKPPVISTVRDILTLRHKAKQIVRKKDISVVHCRSYITALIGLNLKRKHGLKFVFDMRGFWADERIEGGIWNMKNPIYRLIYQYFKRKEKQFFTNADAIVSLTENSKATIHQITKSPNQKIFIIPCCADQNLFNFQNVDKNDLNTLRLNLGGDFHFKLLYLGSLGTWYMFDEMMDFFEELIRNVERSQFLMLSNDLDLAKQKLPGKDWVIDDLTARIFDQQVIRFKKKGFPNSEVLVSQSLRKNVPTFIEYCDASLVFIKPVFSKVASSATKMGEVLSMGKPVITNSEWGDVELLQSKIEDLFVINKFSSSEYLSVINDLKEKRKAKSNIPSDFALNYFSLQNGVDKYFIVYQSLLGP